MMTAMNLVLCFDENKDRQAGLSPVQAWITSLLHTECLCRGIFQRWPMPLTKNSV